MPSKSDMLKLVITGAVLYGAYRFAPNPTIKAMVLGVVGVVVVKNTPIVNQYVAV